MLMTLTPSMKKNEVNDGMKALFIDDPALGMKPEMTIGVCQGHAFTPHVKPGLIVQGIGV